MREPDAGVGKGGGKVEDLESVLKELVTDLAKGNEPTDSEYGSCLLCGSAAFIGHYLHEETCPYDRARRLVRTNWR